MNKVYYSYEDIKNQLHKIIRDMMIDSFKPDYIVGIARGGLVPATHLSHYFEVPLVTVNYSFRDNQTIADNSVSQIIDLLKEQRRILIVDDICDEGHTFYSIAIKLEKYITNSIFSGDCLYAALIHNEAEKMFTPDFVGCAINKIEKPEWCVFPWEEWYTT